MNYTKIFFQNLVQQLASAAVGGCIKCDPLERRFMVNLGDFILEIPSALSREKCLEIVTKFERTPDAYKEAAKVTLANGEQGVHHKRDVTCLDWELSIDHDLKVEAVYSIKKGVEKYIDHVEKINESYAGILDDRRQFYALNEHPQLLRYRRGQKFEWHCDVGKDSLRERDLTILLYLNDVDSEAGGATEFIDGQKICPEAGKLLIFPSHYVHRGMVISRDVHKYVVSAWVKNTA